MSPLLTAAVRVSVIMAAFCAGAAVSVWLAFRLAEKILP